MHCHLVANQKMQWSIDWILGKIVEQFWLELIIIETNFGSFVKKLSWGEKNSPSTSGVTRLDDFWKFLVINFLLKVAQIFGDILGLLL